MNPCHVAPDGPRALDLIGWASRHTRQSKLPVSSAQMAKNIERFERFESTVVPTWRDSPSQNNAPLFSKKKLTAQD
jgi:hypothetical protein